LDDTQQPGLPTASDFTRPAQAAIGPQVACITQTADHYTLVSKVFIEGMSVGEVHAWRNKIRQAHIMTARAKKLGNQAVHAYPFVCAACGHPVYLKATTHHTHYFSHYEKHVAEDADCPFRDGRSLPREVLDRIRYHGQREGERHRRTKRMIEQTLRADVRFTDIAIEERWTSFNEGYRRPDLAALWNGQSVVFEAQVSNTYPDVVAERTLFYQQAGANAIWVFDQPLVSEWRTLHKDNFIANGQHLFMVDEESVMASVYEKKAIFKVITIRPDVQAQRDPVTRYWQLIPAQIVASELIAFERLTLDPEKQTATYFDVEAENRRCRHKMNCATAKQTGDWEDICSEIEEILHTSVDPANTRKWANLVCTIESVRTGAAVGTRFNKPVESLHHLAERFEPMASYAIWACRQPWANAEVVSTPSWLDRSRQLLSALKAGEEPVRRRRTDDLMVWLYPDFGLKAAPV